MIREQPRLQREGRWPELRAGLERLVAAREDGTGDGVELRCEYRAVVAERE